MKKVFMIDHPKCMDIRISGGKARTIHKMRKKFANLFPNAFIIPSDTEIDDSLLPDIAAAMRKLGSDRFAVRSSASLEDMCNFSFAGQFLTELDVCSAEEILISAQRVRNSMYREQVLSYMSDHGISRSDLRMAVLCMPMVADEEEDSISGVIFTADPESTESNICISAVPGLGEKEVAGRVNPEIAVMRAGNNEFECIRHRPYDGRTDFLLNREMRIMLSEYAKKTEKYLQEITGKLYSTDIEYCIQNEKIHFVQIRPDTGRRKDTQCDDLFDKNAQQSETKSNKRNKQPIKSDVESKIIIRAGQTAVDNGIVSGMLRYCRILEDATNLKEGEIVFCEQTSNMWDGIKQTKKAAAIGTGSGSCNSHISILAREYSIPCVVGIGEKNMAILEKYDKKTITVDTVYGTIFDGAISEDAIVGIRSEEMDSDLYADNFKYFYHAVQNENKVYTDVNGSEWIGMPAERTDAVLNQIHRKSCYFISERFGLNKASNRIRNGIFEVRLVDIYRWYIDIRSFSPEKLSHVLDLWDSIIKKYLDCSETFTDGYIEKWILLYTQENAMINLSFLLEAVISEQFNEALAKRNLPEPYRSRIYHSVLPGTPLSWAQQAVVDYDTLLSLTDEERTEEKIKDYATRYQTDVKYSTVFNVIPPVQRIKAQIAKDNESGYKPSFILPEEEIYFPDDADFQVIFKNRMRAMRLKENSQYINLYGKYKMLEKIGNADMIDYQIRGHFPSSARKREISM